MHPYRLYVYSLSHVDDRYISLSAARMIAMHPYSMQACSASLQAVCIYLLAHVSRDGRGDDDDEGGSEVDDGDLGYEVAGGVPVQTSLDVDHQQDDVEDDPHLHRHNAKEGFIINR